MGSTDWLEFNRDLREPVAGHYYKYIGIGMQFPQTFDGGTTAINALLKRINQSIYMILSTTPGERVFRPDFGSNLRKIVFDPNDAMSVNLLRVTVEDALRKWEKRIDILHVTVLSSDDDKDLNQMGIAIQYKIVGTSIVGNYVYPYYNVGTPLYSTGG